MTPSLDPASSVLPERARFLRASIALFLAGFATFSLLYCVQPLLPEFSAQFRVDAAASSLALSLSTGTLALAILLAGAASEAMGRRGLMFASICAASLLNLLASLAPDWHMLLAARALEGFVLGGVPAVAMAYLAEETPPSRLGSAMGVYISGTALGGMFGRVVIGALTELFDWRVAMVSISVLGLLAGVLFLALLPPSRHFVRRPGINLRFHWQAWRAHAANPFLKLLFLIAFLSMGAFVTVYNYLGYHLQEAPFLLGQAEIGLIFLAYIFGVASSSAAGVMADRHGRAPVVTIGALIALAGVALTLSGSVAVIVVGVIAFTIGFFMVHSVASGWVGRAAGSNRSHAASLYLLAYYLGSSVLGSLGGFVWQKAGWTAVVTYGGIGLAAVLALAWLLARRQAAGKDAPGASI